MKSRILTGSAAVVLVLGFGWWMFSGGSQPVEAVEAEAPKETQTDVVSLPAEKVAAAGLEVGLVEYRPLQLQRTVPGRVQYDDTRHVAIKAPTPGVLTDVYVKPGDRVQKGQILARLNSPEVGHARADVLRREAEHQLAADKLKWQKAVCEGLQQLVAAVESELEPRDIAERLNDTALGDYREQVLATYSRFRLAEALAAGVDEITQSGAIAGRTARERKSERDSAAAALKSVVEQSLFQTRQDCAAAQLAADDARRRLQISEHHLRTLLGYEDNVSRNDASRPLSLVEVRAAFDGTIESRNYGVTERVAQGDTLFVLADTTRLWIAADIREREWNALQLASDQQLKVLVPALPDREFTAAVHYIGREVSASSSAVPLVAAIDNPDGLLRPGQFVQVRLPLSEPKPATAVPESAIVEHEGQPFVFRREPSGDFRRVDIQPGLTTDGWTEVLSGVGAGDEVVVRGAFYLKSELLLEREE